MLQSTRNWFRRNRNTFAIGAGVLGAGYLAGQYVLSKITEARQRMSDDRIARDNLRRRFQQNQEDCTYTVLALLPTAAENALKAIPVENILQELQYRKGDKSTTARSTAGSEIARSEVTSTVGEDDGRSLESSSYVHASQMVGSEIGTGAAGREEYKGRSKVQLWNDLKIDSITRAFTLIYTLSLLTLLTRIQLNLLGRRNYLSSVVSLATPPPPSSSHQIDLENRDDDNMDQDYGNDFETNRKYLTFSWWLLHRGWAAVKREVEIAVIEVFGGLTPRDNVSFERLSEFVLEVRKKVEGASEEERRTHKWLEYLLPPRSDEELVLRENGVTTDSSPPETPGLVREDQSPVISTSLRRLLDETSDLVDSPTFTHVLTLTLDAAFSLLIDSRMASQAYNITPQGRRDSSTSTSSNRAEARVQEVSDDDALSLPAASRQKTAKLATILAVFTRQAHAIGSGGNLNTLMGAAPQLKETNEYLAAVETIRDLEAFAAVVYSSNFEFEGVEDTGFADQAFAGMDGDEDAGVNSTQDYQCSSVDVDDKLESAWGSALAR